MNYSLAITLALFAGAASLPTQADEVNLPAKDAVRKVSVPERGMDMKQVEALFGTPESKRGPNGAPPIYYWEYPTYTVYFESNYVIHTVMKYRD